MAISKEDLAKREKYVANMKAMSEAYDHKPTKPNYNVDVSQDTTAHDRYVANMKAMSESYKPPVRDDSLPNVESPDSSIKSLARTAYQPLSGALQKFTYPADIAQALTVGEGLSEVQDLEDRIPELQKRMPSAPWGEQSEYDKDKLMSGVQQAASIFPTQSNLERIIEESTGLPLTPKEGYQDLLRFGGSVAGFRPGNLLEKATAGAVGTGVKAGAEALGAPTILSDILGFTAGGVTPTPSISKAAPKASGLTTRGFESLEKQTKVSPAKYTQINEAVEQDFRKISDKLLKTNPTYKEIVENPSYKQEVIDSFDEVRTLAKGMTAKMPSNEIKTRLLNRVSNSMKKGFVPDEYERAYSNEMNKLYKEVPEDFLYDAERVIDQFRKNNKSLSEIYEIGKSKASNRAKADALIDFNKELASSAEDVWGGSKMIDVFKAGNERWSKIKDVEAINGFIDGLYDGKIDFKKGSKFFENNRVVEPFKKILGKEKFGEYKTLMSDLMSMKEAHKLLKKSEGSGINSTDVMTYLVSPKFAEAKYALDKVKKLSHVMLDKPEYITTWKSALDNFKQGNYDSAKSLLLELKKANEE